MPILTLDLRRWVAITSLLLTGCPAMGLHQGTAPVPRGRYQLGASVNGAVFHDSPGEQRVVGANVEVSLRRGLTEDADLQLKIFGIGVDVGAKYRFLRGDWSMAVLPIVGFTRSPETSATSDALYAWAHLPLIVGRRLSPTVDLNFGPRLLYGTFLPRAGGVDHGLSAGGFVNIDLPLSRAVRIVPELTVIATMAGDVPVRGWSAYLGPGLLFDL